MLQQNRRASKDPSFLRFVSPASCLGWEWHWHHKYGRMEAIIAAYMVRCTYLVQPWHCWWFVFPSSPWGALPLTLRSTLRLFSPTGCYRKVCVCAVVGHDEDIINVTPCVLSDPSEHLLQQVRLCLCLEPKNVVTQQLRSIRGYLANQTVVRKFCNTPQSVCVSVCIIHHQ